MHEQAGELTRQVGFFHLSDDAATSVASAATARAQTVAAEAEAVFAAVRNTAPVAARPARLPVEPASATGVWKEF
jgi:hypothetical protein